MNKVLKELILAVGTIRTSSFGVCPKCGFYLKLVFSPFGKFIVCPKCDFFEKVE
jgi:ssDNA-binding Zn-finger/Zn-ribbon topoisomerase 1